MMSTTIFAISSVLTSLLSIVPSGPRICSSPKLHTISIASLPIFMLKPEVDLKLWLSSGLAMRCLESIQRMEHLGIQD